MTTTTQQDQNTGRPPTRVDQITYRARVAFTASCASGCAFPVREHAADADRDAQGHTHAGVSRG